MLDAGIVAEIRRLFYAEHWRVGTIASQLGVHPEAVQRAINRVPGQMAKLPPRRRLIDPFLPWLTQTLERYPRLGAPVLHRMLRERGYPGGLYHLRRLLRSLRPSQREAFTRLMSLPGEAAQVDWADFGRVTLGRAQRRLSAFVMTLCYSRALYVEFFFDQTLGNFLRGHVRAFEHFAGVTRQVVTDNLRSVVLERRGRQDDGNACGCSPREISRYLSPLSGALLDRIDLIVPVPRVRLKELRSGAGESSFVVAERIARAREIQRDRCGRLNAYLSVSAVRYHCPLGASGNVLLDRGVERLGFSAREVASLLKVARTIADLSGSDSIRAADVAEAMQGKAPGREAVLPSLRGRLVRSRAFGGERREAGES